jgi:hypothetical protein
LRGCASRRSEPPLRFDAKAVGADLASRIRRIAFLRSAKELAINCEDFLKFRLTAKWSVANLGIIFLAGDFPSHIVRFMHASEKARVESRLRRSTNRWLVPSMLGKWLSSSLSASRGVG